MTIDSRPTGSLVAQLADAALDHLAEQRSAGYAEAAHRMTFAHALGFTGEGEQQVGDVFVRAIVADALCDATDAGFDDCSPTVAAECDYLVGRRRRSRVGGWAYFPDLPELPSDIDDLAQVMQVLVRCGRHEDLRDFAEAPLGLALRNGVGDGGALSTWILPRHDADDDENRQALFVQAAWGDTPDPEVVANLLYALCLYDAARFAEVIAEGAAWVRSCQAPGGEWVSTWYHGPFYGTYVCSRLLAAAGDQQGLERARAFLDRRWEPKAGQLATVLWLCASAVLLPRLRTPPGWGEHMAGALAHLATAVATEGWAAPAFIVMHPGRTRGKRGRLSYGSSAITAAFALKAVAALSTLSLD